MPAHTATTKGRGRRGGGTLQWIALLTAATIIMGLTFTLGILVGRQWSRPTSVTTTVESGARKTVPPGKRGGLAGADVDPPQMDQKQLTFYQTLTAPLGRGSADAAPRHVDKARAASAAEPARSDAHAPSPTYTSRSEPVVEKPATADSASADMRPRAAAEPVGPWAVQAAAFKTQAQADALQKQLKQAGFDAYVASATTSDGHANYRVRIGTFKSKVEAQRVAERVRGERSLAAFITPK
ncbi:MAG TPA: SPOR domain-containing protein [Methylomirabilota bacterium]|jgi:cell division septation protein DedD|nr:SPOR domain-containing protein [Methylomirabilota bacterium]